MPPEFPPMPADWNKTVGDLCQPPKYGIGVPQEQFEWARQYERKLLSGWARFPKNKEKFEALEDADIHYSTHYRAPFTGGDKCTIPKGTIVTVRVFEQDPEPISVQAFPENYDELEQIIVPPEERSNEYYGSFSLGIGTATLNRSFKRIEP